MKMNNWFTNLKSSYFNKIIRSEKLKKEIVRYAISFFFALLISTLISDFPFYKSLISYIKLDILLTNLLASSTEEILNLFNYPTFSNENFLQIIGAPGVRFTYGCLGIRELAFFVVFIIFQFGKIKHKLWYIPLGIILLLFLNTVRSTIVAWGQFQNSSQAQLIHDIVSPVIMYPTILFLWIFWITRFGKPPVGNTFLEKLFKNVKSLFFKV